MILRRIGASRDHGWRQPRSARSAAAGLHDASSRTKASHSVNRRMRRSPTMRPAHRQGFSGVALTLQEFRHDPLAENDFDYWPSTDHLKPSPERGADQFLKQSNLVGEDCRHAGGASFEGHSAGSASARGLRNAAISVPPQPRHDERPTMPQCRGAHARPARMRDAASTISGRAQAVPGKADRRPRRFARWCPPDLDAGPTGSTSTAEAEPRGVPPPAGLAAMSATTSVSG